MKEYHDKNILYVKDPIIVIGSFVYNHMIGDNNGISKNIYQPQLIRINELVSYCSLNINIDVDILIKKTQLNDIFQSNAIENKYIINNILYHLHVINDNTVDTFNMNKLIDIENENANAKYAIKYFDINIHAHIVNDDNIYPLVSCSPIMYYMMMRKVSHSSIQCDTMKWLHYINIFNSVKNNIDHMHIEKVISMKNNDYYDIYESIICFK
jgi:hypothetical protein